MHYKNKCRELRKERWDVGSWECYSVNCVKQFPAVVIVATTAVENCIFKSKLMNYLFGSQKTPSSRISQTYFLLQSMFKIVYPKNIVIRLPELLECDLGP